MDRRYGRQRFRAHAAIHLLAWTLVATAQDGTPPAGLIPPGADPVVTAPSRRAVLERSFFDSSEWEFHYSIKDIPADLQELVFGVVGSNAVGPGEPFNHGDLLLHDSGTQHLYTAANSRFVVVVWHRGSFSGARTGALIYDRIEHDACRYDFSTTYAIVSLETELKDLIANRRSPTDACKYQEPGFLSR